MKLKRTENTIRNVFYGTAYKFVCIIGPFAVRTVMIYIMGNEYVGLGSLFTSILSFLSLAELGVGSALVFSMYKPIAEDDIAMINALYHLYKKIYRIIGSIIFVIGVGIVPFLSKLVGTDLPPDTNLYILYAIYLFNTILSYWVYGYKQALLIAFQRSDIISKRSLIIQLIMYIAQISCLYITRNYYVYIINLPIATIITNIANKIIVDKMFPQYKCQGKVSKEVELSIKKNVLALFGTKANSIVLHATDNIVISAFLGLAIVGKYGNYYYIMNSVAAFLKMIYSSITAGLGNSLETESINKNYSIFKALSFLNAWIVMFCSCCLLCLYQPFMKIWVKDKNMFGLDVVILLVVYFYTYMIRRIILTYKDAAGIWWEDRFRPYAVMIINLGLNVLLCQAIGICGIIISTIISMLVAIPWENYTVFKYVFKKGQRQYYIEMLSYFLISVILCFGTGLVCSKFPYSVLFLFVRLAVCVVIPNAVWMILFCKKDEYTYAKRIFMQIKNHV